LKYDETASHPHSSTHTEDEKSLPIRRSSVPRSVCMTNKQTVRIIKIYHFHCVAFIRGDAEACEELKLLC
jgi:hypothetical protein